MRTVSGVAYAPGASPVFAGDASARSVFAMDSSVVVGGVEYDPVDPRICTEMKADGARCTAFAVSGGTVCIGHRNRKEKEARDVEEAD
ncbi:hypothetical protein EBZ38_09605 [bacterium]|nr:hypothetical protein [bacterium]NDD84509.1 hypothetical protein [bacterium]NDG19293.1 hypothetical protein [Betaproteobacteria bacterium]